MRKKELDETLYEQITKMSDEGNELMDEGYFHKALEKFTAAYNLLPEPKHDWEACFWLTASIGDAYFNNKDFESSLEFFNESYKFQEGIGNPFILLRMGQSYFETGNYAKAKDFLLRAYMLDGEDVFGGSETYLEWLTTQVKL